MEPRLNARIGITYEMFLDTSLTDAKADGAMLFLCCLAYCARYPALHGYLDKGIVSRISRLVGVDMQRASSRVTKASLWTDCGGMFGIQNWRDYYAGPPKRTTPSNWHKIRRAVFHRDNYCCQECGTREGTFHCDHILPVSKGGSDELDNLQTLCARCNIVKGSKLQLEP